MRRFKTAEAALLRPAASSAGLSGRHLARCPDRQFQNLAERVQIGIPGSHPVGLPKIDAGSADAYAFGNLGDGKSALQPGVAKIAGEAGFTGQRYGLL